MKFRLTEDKKSLQLIEYTKNEMTYLTALLRVEVENARFHPLVKKRLWDGFINYFKPNMTVAVGLWQEIVKLCQKIDTKIEIDGIETLFDFSINFDEFENWVRTQFIGSIVPHGYQIAAAYKILTTKRCLGELATSAGKTLILFLVFSYLSSRNFNEKFLLIVPNIGLVKQAADDFLLYNKTIKDKINLRVQHVHEGFKIVTDDEELSKTSNRYSFVNSTKLQKLRLQEKEGTLAPEICLDFDRKNVFVGCYQSLIKFDAKLLSKFTIVGCDEAHSAKATTVQKIYDKCLATRRIGVTGTVPKISATRFAIMSQIGPCVVSVSANELMNGGFISNLEIQVLKLKWTTPTFNSELADISTLPGIDGAKILTFEKQAILASQIRLDFIANLTSKMTKNTLLLFQHIEYGNLLYDAVRAVSDKVVYHVDGSVGKDIREGFRKDMEFGEDKILIASFGTFSTGISINNIHNIILCESYKSETIVRQSIGRGLRKHKDKDKLTVYDIVDDMSSNNFVNLILKQSKERIKIYKEQEFAYKIIDIKL
jgi:superfamily II DNA or RNA helicase